MLLKSAKTQQKLLDDALTIIRRSGALTIRELTEKEEFNIAAVNYHFRDKDNFNRAIINKLFDEVIQWIKTTEKVKICKTKLEVAQTISRFTYDVIHTNFGAIKYIFALKLEKISGNALSLQEVITARFRDLVAVIYPHLRNMRPDDTDDQLYLRYTACFSSYILPIVYCGEDDVMRGEKRDNMLVDNMTAFLLI